MHIILCHDNNLAGTPLIFPPALAFLPVSPSLDHSNPERTWSLGSCWHTKLHSAAQILLRLVPLAVQDIRLPPGCPHFPMTSRQFFCWFPLTNSLDHDHSHWSKNTEAWLSLVERFKVLKYFHGGQLSYAIKNQLKAGKIPPLCLYGIRIGGFHAQKGSIIVPLSWFFMA